MSREGTDQGYRPISLRGLGPGDVQRIGVAVGRNLSSGTTVALYGHLGAGKTFLIQAICKGLGVTERVTSPTFTIVNEYRGRYPIFHIDLYRLEGADELREIGLDEMARGEAVCLIEWAEKAAGYLESIRLDIEIERRAEERRDLGFSFTGNGVWAGVYRAIQGSGEEKKWGD